MQGGKRKNAGRRAGIPNKVTLQREKRLSEGGYMPLDVMLAGMRYNFGLVLAEQRKPKKTKNLEEIDKRFALAGYFAEKAAPYSHPRLATITTNANINMELTLRQLIEQSLQPLEPPANDDADAEPDMIDVTPKIIDRSK